MNYRRLEERGGGLAQVCRPRHHDDLGWNPEHNEGFIFLIPWNLSIEFFLNIAFLECL